MYSISGVIEDVDRIDKVDVTQRIVVMLNWNNSHSRQHGIRSWMKQFSFCYVLKGRHGDSQSSGITLRCLVACANGRFIYNEPNSLVGTNQRFCPLYWSR